MVWVPAPTQRRRSALRTGTATPGPATRRGHPGRKVDAGSGVESGWNASNLNLRWLSVIVIVTGDDFLRSSLSPEWRRNRKRTVLVVCSRYRYRYRYWHSFAYRDLINLSTHRYTSSATAEKTKKRSRQSREYKWKWVGDRFSDPDHSSTAAANIQAVNRFAVCNRARSQTNSASVQRVRMTDRGCRESA